MSRIGKKPIPLPTGVKYKVEGNTVLVEGPKGKVSALIAKGIELETKDGTLHVNREDDKYAAVHGLTRALVFNAVQGVTKGWTRELDIVGIGYRAELKGKGMVVFTLGYSHPIEFPLIQSKPTSPSLASTGRRLDRLRPTCARCASPTRTRTRASATRTRS
jgi:large subunit ribosomal protein L6